MAITAFLIAAGLFIDQRTQPALVSGPMVQLPRPDTLTIIWHMEATFDRGAVLLKDPDGSERIEEATGPDAQRYEATFTGLAAGTAYTYTVLNYGLLGREIEVAGPFRTSTPLPRGRPFRFVAFGDSGIGSRGQEDLAKLIAQAKPDVVIHTGDLVYPAGAIDDYHWNFFEPNAEMIRFAPFMPCLGNHDCATDGGGPFLSVFVLPDNGPDGIESERNYWFDYGDARFVALDSNLDTQQGIISLEKMKTVIAPWLRRVLTDCDARWKFVYYHHPFYTGSVHIADGTAYLKDAYASIFEECGVDIAFSGHNHLYERTAPILADEIVEEGRGVVYVVTGAGGARRYAEQLPPPDYIQAYEDRVFSFTQVDLTADRLELKQIGEDGQIIDAYVIHKATPGVSGSN